MLELYNLDDEYLIKIDIFDEYYNDVFFQRNNNDV